MKGNTTTAPKDLSVKDAEDVKGGLVVIRIEGTLIWSGDPPPKPKATGTPRECGP